MEPTSNAQGGRCGKAWKAAPTGRHRKSNGRATEMLRNRGAQDVDPLRWTLGAIYWGGSANSSSKHPSRCFEAQKGNWMMVDFCGVIVRIVELG